MTCDGRIRGRHGRRNPTQDSKMIFNQAESRGIRAHVQALTHIGGEQGGAVALSYFLPGITACGLSWEQTP